MFLSEYELVLDGHGASTGSATVRASGSALQRYNKRMTLATNWQKDSWRVFFTHIEKTEKRKNQTDKVFANYPLDKVVVFLFIFCIFVSEN